MGKYKSRNPQTQTDPRCTEHAARIAPTPTSPRGQRPEARRTGTWASWLVALLASSKAMHPAPCSLLARGRPLFSRESTFLGSSSSCSHHDRHGPRPRHVRLYELITSTTVTSVSTAPTTLDPPPHLASHAQTTPSLHGWGAHPHGSW